MHAVTFNSISSSGHSSLEKYTSNFIRKGYERYYGVRGELEIEQRLQHIDPHSSGYSSISFPFSWAAQSGAWVLIPASSLQPIWTSCRTGLYNNLTSTYFLRASHLYLIQPVDSQGYPLISLTGCTCYLHRCISFLTDRSIRLICKRNLDEKLIHKQIQNFETRWASFWHIK